MFEALRPMIRFVYAVLIMVSLIAVTVVALWFLSPTARYRLETPTRGYADAAEAQPLFRRASFVGSGFPGFQVPPSASDIRLTHNIDTEEWWFSFHFAAQDSASLTAVGRPVDPATAPGVTLTQPRWLRKWPTTLRGLHVTVPADPEALGCLAVDWRSHRAYLWRCRTRAT